MAQRSRKKKEYIYILLSEMWSCSWINFEEPQSCRRGQIQVFINLSMYVLSPTYHSFLDHITHLIVYNHVLGRIPFLAAL